MKANEAPEKLYIDLFNGEFNVSYSPANNSIEYVHTDAFIEKAEKYLTGKFINDVSVLAGGAVHINFDSAISNFIKYMKGE